MIRPFVPHGAAVLRTPAEAVAGIDAGIEALWEDMIDTMEAMPGVGLAAPQIGVGLALAVVDASAERGQAIRMANPEIIEASGQLVGGTEASPNLPGVSARVMRPATVEVRFMNAAGVIERRGFDGLWARSVQHQIDHLAGRLYIDRLGPVKRAMLLKKVAKQRRARA